MSTIFALSSGAPPAAIGVIRISGPAAGAALRALCGTVPPPRRAVLRTLRDEGGAVLDRALVLWFPGPASATGEDCAELHCHGGRAVIRAVEDALAALPGLEPAQAGAFTRRAFANGRIDLAEAEGLADLLAAETELQRRVAQGSANGAISRVVDQWRETVMDLSAQIEASLDFSDEEDAAHLGEAFHVKLSQLCDELSSWLSRPSAERLRGGLRVVLAGPPNAGKSTLFNRILDSEAAIVSPLAGTTRDVIERPIALGGIPFVLIDTAGLRHASPDSIERAGIARAQSELESADLVLWLGPEGEGPDGAYEVESRIDDVAKTSKRNPDFRVSGRTGEGVPELIAGLVLRGRAMVPKPGEVAINRRQRTLLGEAHGALENVVRDRDPLLQGEGLRLARSAFDRILGRVGQDDMLDALFGRFCIGK